MTDEPGAECDQNGGRWQEVLDDAAAIAGEYRDRGWEVLTVSPRDVAPWTTDGTDDGRPASGFSILAPDEKFDAVRTVVDRESAAFDAAEIYRRTVGETVLTIAIELDRATETAVVLPLYYRRGEATEALEIAVDRGELLCRVRPDSREDWVSFTHEEPTLFVPDAGDAPS